MKDDVLNSMVEVTLSERDDFLKIRETLTRIGIASKNSQTLTQTCHILHKKGKYYIPHFKEMFMLDGKGSNFSDEDQARRNTIVNLLEEWKLIAVVEPESVQGNVADLSSIKIIPFAEKSNWNLVSKYTVGVKR